MWIDFLFYNTFDAKNNLHSIKKHCCNLFPGQILKGGKSEPVQRTRTTTAIQMQFKEFDDLSDVLKSLERDQKKLMADCQQTEQGYVDKYNNLKEKVDVMQAKVDDFLTDMEKDISVKKTQLVKGMRETIEKLKNQQKTSTELIETLQRKLVETSKEMEVKLNLVEKKFEDTVHVKDQFNNLYSQHVSFLTLHISWGNSVIMQFSL